MLGLGGANCGDYAIQLPGGHGLVRIWAGAVLLHRPDRSIIADANIDACAVYDELAVGHVETAEFEPERGMSTPGYFVVNTQTHGVTEGLHLQSWAGTLRSISDLPRPNAPSRFDRDCQAG